MQSRKALAILLFSIYCDTMLDKMKTALSLEDYKTGVLGADRAILARAITLIESIKQDHQAQAQDLLQALLPHTGQAHRIGITGVPGVGKSTLIEALGQMLIARGHKVAVLAVDPTSHRSKGSILGDKTRMQNLSIEPNAFIRPSPTSGTLGGVSKKTRETMSLCEAAGFDIILVETVGVGQSEIAVAEMVDFFLVLMLPGAGDELQGIKKGVLEIADMIAVNKADGENKTLADMAARDYRAALHIITPSSNHWSPPVLTLSGLNNEGLDEMWQKILDHKDIMTKAGAFVERRQRQAVQWMHDMLEDQLRNAFLNNSKVAERIPLLEREVSAGSLTATKAVTELIQLIGLQQNMAD